MNQILIHGEKPVEENNLSQHSGFRKKHPTLFAPLQIEAYKRVREGRSCALVAPTSSGKTLAVAAPLFETRRPAVFVLPFRALVADQSQELPRIASVFGIAEDEFVKVQGGTPDNELVDALKREYILMTPDKLVSLFVSGRNGNAAAIHILNKYDFVFDEVHIYNAMMQTSLLYFLRSVKYWQETRQRKSGFYFLSATFPDELWKVLESDLGLNEADKIVGTSFTGDVKLLIKPFKTITKTTMGEVPIADDIRELDIETNTVCIFNSAHRAWEVCEKLDRGLLFIGQDKMNEVERKRNFNQFMQFPEENALVGSPAIEAGVDFESRNLVIEESHRDSFVQRFGRAARSGRDAFVLAYSDTLHQMVEAGELESEYSRVDFLDVLKANTQPRESRKIFAGIASFAYYSFWKGDADFPFDKEHRNLCERLKRKGVPDNLLGFRSLTPYTHYQTGESISFKSLFRKRLSIESKTRKVFGRPDPRIYYKSPKRNPVPAYLKDNDVAEKESLGESLIILAPITFELVIGHRWKYWVLLELAKADDLDNQSDNILLEIDGIPFTSTDGQRGVSVRFYDLDV